MEGREVVAKIFATSTTLREGAYTGEWKLDDRRTLLRWKGKIQGHELESFDIIEENEEGLIVDRTIAFRPMHAAKLFRDAMGLLWEARFQAISGSMQIRAYRNGLRSPKQVKSNGNAATDLFHPVTANCSSRLASAHTLTSCSGN